MRPIRAGFAFLLKLGEIKPQFLPHHTARGFLEKCSLKMTCSLLPAWGIYIPLAPA